MLDQLEALILVAKSDEERRQVTAVKGSVNGVDALIIADSGAARSLCSRKQANEWKLVDTGVNHQFRGLGRATGGLTEAVDVRLGQRSRSVQFCVVESEDVPPLLGRWDLGRFGVLIDPLVNCLVDRDTLKIVVPSAIVALCQSSPVAPPIEAPPPISQVRCRLAE